MKKGRDGGNGEGKKEKTDENSGHYVIASSRLPKRRPLERRTLAPINNMDNIINWDWVQVSATFAQTVVNVQYSLSNLVTSTISQCWTTIANLVDKHIKVIYFWVKALPHSQSNALSSQFQTMDKILYFSWFQ